MTFFKDYCGTQILRWTIGSLALAICASAWSQVLPPLTLAETLKLAANQSRQLAAQDAAVAAAREMSVSAGQLPDPVLRFGVDNLPVNGPDRFSTTADFMTMHRIGVMQELTREEKRRLKSERSEHEAMRRIASPMVGGMVTAPLLSMFVVPVAYLLLRRPRAARVGTQKAVLHQPRKEK